MESDVNYSKTTRKRPYHPVINRIDLDHPNILTMKRTTKTMFW